MGEGVDGYTLLIAEFVPDGDLKEHTIARGDTSRKVNYKQQWSKSTIYFYFFNVRAIY
jgi:hypothetical protein